MNEKGQINNILFKECSDLMKKVRECRHQTTLERHLRKFNWLCQQPRDGCSNKSGGQSKSNHTCTLAPITALTSAATTTSTTTTATTVQLDKWVKNLSGVTLTKAQVSQLAHGPNFTIAPRHPLWGVHCHCGASMPELGAT